MTQDGNPTPPWHTSAPSAPPTYAAPQQPITTPANYPPPPNYGIPAPQPPVTASHPAAASYPQPPAYPTSGMPSSGAPAGYPTGAMPTGYPTSGMPGTPPTSYPTSGMPGTPPTGYPTSGMPGTGYPQPAVYPPPAYGPAGPAGPPGYPGYPVAAPTPRKKRHVALIVSLVVVFVLLSVGGGLVWFIGSRVAEGGGGASSTSVVSLFTMDIYQFYDADSATKLVCPAARDRKKIVAKINEIKAQNARYDTPTYSFGAPKVVKSAPKQADVTITVTLKTKRFQTAAQNLRFVTTKGSTGWFVCDVSQI